MSKRGFTLIELLVVVAIIAMMLAVLMPSLQRARLAGKIVAVNSDLRQIGIALQCYQIEHKKFPPTREDCNEGVLNAHLYQLPKELAAGNYLPKKDKLNAMSTVMEDRFNPGHTYKYRSVGECIRDRNRIDRWSKAQLWVSTGFPKVSSLDDGRWYSTPEESPVQWTLFSLGPKFEEQWLRTAANKYPVPQQLWYGVEQKRGFIVRLRTKYGSEIGTFEGRP